MQRVGFWLIGCTLPIYIADSITSQYKAANRKQYTRTEPILLPL